MKNTIETERLYLRTFLVKDISQGYLDALNDESVIGLTESRHEKWNREKTIRYIRESNASNTSELIGIFLKKSDKHIGNIRLHHINDHHKRVELGILIHDKNEWSNGYGTEALKEVCDYVFKDLGFRKVCADYYASNSASARLFSKAGFVIEGILKDHFILDGDTIDTICVAKFSNRQSLHIASAKESKIRNHLEGHSRITSAGPSITQKETDLVTEAVTHGWHENMNKYIDLFVEEFSDFVGVRYCLPTAHCTDAIHLALLGLNIGPGDEVIVPDITWVASAAPITYVGAVPVFADMNEKSWCLCPKSFERSITDKTKAVMVVDLFGNMPEMDGIREIAEEYNIAVIEDAAEGIGGEYKNQPAGTFGQISIFSFNATKLVMSGQGGLLATNNKEIYERCKLLSHHGISKKPGDRYYWSNEIGYNYNWTNIQAALALAQLRRIDELLEKKRRIFNWYYERLKDVEGIRLNSQPDYIKSTYWISIAMVDEKYGMDKEFLEKEFEKYNIDMRPFFYPISSMPPYATYCVGKEMSKVNPISYRISPYGLCLPSGNSLTEDDVGYVCNAFKEILSKRCPAEKT